MAGVPGIVSMFIEILRVMSTVPLKIIKGYMACIELRIYSMHIEDLGMICPSIQMVFNIESY